MDGATVRAAVHEVVNALVEHYSQPIHCETVTATVGRTDAASTWDESNENDDAGLVPLFVQALVHRLIQTPWSTDNDCHFDNATQQLSRLPQRICIYRELLQSYAMIPKLRPVAREPHHDTLDTHETNSDATLQCSFTVLWHYELLISSMYEPINDVSRVRDAAFDETFETSSDDALTQLMQDIAAIQRDDDTSSNNDRLMLLCRGEEILWRLVRATLTAPICASHPNPLTHDSAPILRQLVCGLLGATTTKWRFYDVDPTILDRFDATHYLAHPPHIVDQFSGTKLRSSTPRLLELVGLHAPEAVREFDTTRFVATTTRVWNVLHRIVTASYLPCDPHTTIERVEMQRRVIEVLGWPACAQCLRFHLFHRDNSVAPTVAPTKQRLHLGHVVADTRTVPPSIPCDARHAMLHFLSLLPHVTHEVLDAILPIVYAWLGSAHEPNVQWGAVTVSKLLSCPVIPTTEPVWTTARRHNLITLLNSAMEHHRVGATLAVVGAAQRAVLQLSGYASTADSADRARALATTLQSWLIILDRNSRHFTKDHLIWGLLWGGILPLLHDAAVIELQESGTALCVELGRLGLSAQCSVLREDSGYTHLFASDSDRFGIMDSISLDAALDEDALNTDSVRQRHDLYVSVHSAALTALCNLFVAAHAVMPRHAGKIMCDLVAYLVKLQSCSTHHATLIVKVDVSHEWHTLTRLAYHAAAMAWIVCGASAEAILSRLDEYNDEVQGVVVLIRTRAHDMVHGVDAKGNGVVGTQDVRGGCAFHVQS